MSRQAAEERYRQRRLSAYREAERRPSGSGLVQPDEIRLIEIDPIMLHVALNGPIDRTELPDNE